MKEVKVTITSKNQISIPTKIVRKLKLSRSRQLQLRQRGNDIILTPLPSLSESLADVWRVSAKHVKRPLSTEEINESVRRSAAGKCE